MISCHMVVWYISISEKVPFEIGINNDYIGAGVLTFLGWKEVLRKLVLLEVYICIFKNNIIAYISE